MRGEVLTFGKNLHAQTGAVPSLYPPLYTRLHRRPPAETDMQEYFRVSPPSVSVHQMVLTLERAGLIRKATKNASQHRGPCRSETPAGANLTAGPLVPLHDRLNACFAVSSTSFEEIGARGKPID
jgi:hypothetical protein